MNIKAFLCTAGCCVFITGAFAQKGVDNGTRFGSGADSVNCVKNISLFSSYAKTNNFKDALEFWHTAYNECPAATKDIYLYGVRIVGWQIDNETDPAKKDALIKDLMTVYDKRIKYFGDDPKYGKDWIVGRKAQDYFQRMGEKADPNQLYSWTKEAVDEFGDKTDLLAISFYMAASSQLMIADPSKKETYIQDYLKVSAILEKQIAATADEKEKEALLATKSGLDTGFANSGAADCETLQTIYGDKVEQNKENLAYLKETIALLRRMRCNEIEAYFAAATYAHKLEPTAESARGLGMKAIRDKDYNAAIPLFEEAANMEQDNSVKAEDYYKIAAMLSDQKNYAKSRQYCQKAIDANPNYGSPYILIGHMYAATAGSIYPDDPVLRKTVYCAAVDKFEKARQMDASVSDEVSKLIGTYRSNFPSTEEIFMHPDLTKGNAYKVTGWIGEQTTVRSRD
jgi:tetratricopeptide (TPR) repeat protein